MLPLNENMVGFGEVEKVVAFIDKLEYVGYFHSSILVWGLPLVAQLVKSPPAMQETLVQFLVWEVPLEKG